MTKASKVSVSVDEQGVSVDSFTGVKREASGRLSLGVGRTTTENTVDCGNQNGGSKSDQQIASVGRWQTNP